MSEETKQIKQSEDKISNEGKEAKKEHPCGCNFGKQNECSFATGEPFSLKTIANIVYVCQALSYFFGISAVVGVILNYLRRDETRGTWLESHFVWQIRTFWLGLLFAIIGYVLIIIFIGFLILAVNLVWIIYRVVKGWIRLQEGKPVANCRALL